jgi:hypothetical protein
VTKKKNQSIRVHNFGLAWLGAECIATEEEDLEREMGRGQVVNFGCDIQKA